MTMGSSSAAAATDDGLKARRTLERLAKLPASIETIRRTLDASLDPDCTASRLEEILSSDAAATGGLLKLANSAFFGVRRQVRTPVTAIGVVGLRRLRTLLRHLMAGRILESLGGRHPAIAVCRRRAMSAAVIAAEIGARLGRGDEAELRIAGLLHNVGELAAAVDDPDRYNAVIARPAAAATEASRAWLGLDFEEITVALMEAWGFPPTYVAAGGRWREGPAADASDEIRRFVSVIRVAGRAALGWRPEEDAGEFDESVLELAAEPPIELRREEMAAIAAGVPVGVADLLHTL